jgi:ribosome-associated translation inhibitor RaiA
MFDEKKFEKIAQRTEQLIDQYGDDKEAQEIVRDNLLLLVDMIFDEIEKQYKKTKDKRYLEIADKLYKKARKENAYDLL